MMLFWQILKTHHIKLTTEELIRTMWVIFCFSLYLCKDARTIIRAKMMEPYSSPYGFPVVIMEKKDWTNIFSIDFHAINKTQSI